MAKLRIYSSAYPWRESSSLRNEFPFCYVYDLRADLLLLFDLVLVFANLSQFQSGSNATKSRIGQKLQTLKYRHNERGISPPLLQQSSDLSGIVTGDWFLALKTTNLFQLWKKRHVFALIRRFEVAILAF